MTNVAQVDNDSNELYREVRVSGWWFRIIQKAGNALTSKRRHEARMKLSYADRALNPSDEEMKLFKDLPELPPELSELFELHASRAKANSVSSSGRGGPRW